MKQIPKFNRFELISFITGFCLLTYELAAARVLAPSIGSSTYVWTSVIGIIIAALALGFFIGGIIADRRNQASDLALLLLAAAFTATITLTMYPAVLDALDNNTWDVRLQALCVAIVLFAPTSFAIGMTSPYIAKINVRSLTTTGRKIASIDALNSLGGIAGTFLTGFVLFGYIGSRQTFLVVIVLLLSASWLIVPQYRRLQRLGISLIIILTSILSVLAATSVVAIDTPSAHYEINNYTYYDGTKIRGLTTGPGGIQSAIHLNGSSEPVFWYAQEMADLAIQKQPERILMLGGGAFTLPQYLAEVLPDTQIDVIEIDPGLAPLSREYFNYTDPKNVDLYFMDARTFINQSATRYDMVLVDAYGDASIPFALMTKEYGQGISRLVAKDGVLVANIIAGTSGPCRSVLNAMNQIYKHGLPEARYAINRDTNSLRTNIIALYSVQPQSYGIPMPPAEGPLYDDNFSPSERLYYECQRAQ